MTGFSPPFLVFEGLDLSIFESLEQMISGLEGVDVEDGVYEAFDSVGRVVRLEAVGVMRGRFTVYIGRTSVDLTERPAIDVSRFRDLLRAHMQATGQAVGQNAHLSELVAISLARQRRSE